MPFLTMSHSLDLFFFNDPATTEIYTLSLHDALPIFERDADVVRLHVRDQAVDALVRDFQARLLRSEEHTSELQSPVHLVCRLLLEKKNNIIIISFLTK